MKCWITPAEAAAAVRRGRGRGVRIAVLDSGIETSHPAFGGRPFCDDLAVVEDAGTLKMVPGGGADVFGHGTAVAGIIHEMAPEAEIGSIRVLGESLAARTPSILQGACEAIDRGYHILNCSLGCGIYEHGLLYKAWVDQAYLRGVHVVAACNNADLGRSEWPAFFLRRSWA
ncbi:MAG: S8 family serine peptidase [Chthoniobacter sp.]